MVVVGAIIEWAAQQQSASHEVRGPPISQD